MLVVMYGCCLTGSIRNYYYFFLVFSFSMTKHISANDGGDPACPLMQFDKKRVKKKKN